MCQMCAPFELTLSKAADGGSELVEADLYIPSCLLARPGL